ncbi:MAG: hypothetical protein JST00_04570 [Deltaproteobacteria bacterium]|nr:hypothetical protein [Deltaproteobacteria bacterium]
MRSSNAPRSTRGRAPLRGILVLLFAIVVAAIGIRDARAELVANAAPPFRLTVPAGFVARPDQNKGDQILSFHRPSLVVGDVGAIIAVDRMRGTIGREKPPVTDLARLSPGGGEPTIESVRWRRFDVWLVRSRHALGGKDLVFFLVQLPLKPEAIQLKVAIDAKDEAEGRALMAQVLATVEGESTWLDDGQRSRKLGEGVGRLLGIVIVLLVVVVLGVRRLRA